MFYKYRQSLSSDSAFVYMKYLPAYQMDPSAVQDAILQTMIKMNRMFIPVQIDHLR